MNISAFNNLSSLKDDFKNGEKWLAVTAPKISKVLMECPCLVTCQLSTCSSARLVKPHSLAPPGAWSLQGQKWPFQVFLLCFGRLHMYLQCDHKLDILMVKLRFDLELVF